jgi:hypothetical protein
MRSHDSDETRLWNVWLAITGALVGGALVVVGGLVLLWLGLGRPRVRAGQPLLPADQLDLVRVVLVLTGGLGGLVALVVAYRRQRLAESQAWRDVRSHRQENYKLFNELYVSTSELLGHESAAVRQAGVYGMARLADDWPAYRQVCIDVLCAYLRTPAHARQADRRGEREVRLSAIRLIAQHVRTGSDESWRDQTLELDGAVFEGQSVVELVRNAGL